MPDAGDDMGMDFKQLVSTVSTQVMMDFRLSRNQFKQFESVKGSVDRENNEAILLREEVESGDMREVVVKSFDLSDFTADQRAVVLDGLKGALERYGFDPDELTPVMGEGVAEIDKTFSFRTDDADPEGMLLKNWLDDASIPYMSNLDEAGDLQVTVSSSYAREVEKVARRMCQKVEGLADSRFAFPDGFSDPVSVEFDELAVEKWNYTYYKDNAEAFSHVIESYLPDSLEKGGLAEMLGISSGCYAVSGFGYLDASGRESFHKAVESAAAAKGLDLSEVKVSRNIDGSLAGDISVPLSFKDELESICHGYNAEHGTHLTTMYDLAGADQIESFDANYSNAKELGRYLLSTGNDGVVNMTQNGYCILKVDPDTAPDIKGLCQRWSTQKAEQVYRKNQVNERIAGKTQSARSKIAHAKDGAEYMRQLQRDGAREARDWVKQQVKTIGDKVL